MQNLIYSSTKVFSSFEKIQDSELSIYQPEVKSELYKNIFKKNLFGCVKVYFFLKLCWVVTGKCKARQWSQLKHFRHGGVKMKEIYTVETLHIFFLNLC